MFVGVMVSIFPLRLGNVTLDTGSVREAEGWQHYCFLAARKDRTCSRPIADRVRVLEQVGGSVWWGAPVRA